MSNDAFTFNFNDLLSVKDKLKKFSEALDKIGSCDSKPDEPCLDVSTEMMDAFKLVKEFGYALSDPFSKGSKGSTGLDFGNTIAGKFNCCHRRKHPTDYNEELQRCIRESGVTITRQSADKAQVPDLFYDRKSHYFWYCENSGVYQSLGASAAADMLACCGLSSERLPDGTSEISRHLVSVRNENGIDGVLSLAGYAPGLHTIKGRKILVPHGCSLIEPKEPTKPETENYKHVYAIITGLFGDDTARAVFLLHLRECWLSLRSGLRSGGIACAIVGPSDAGKTLLLEKIVVPMLGGRKANAYAFLSGASNFNDELVGCEVHVIDDGSPFDTLEARKKFGNALKSHVAGGEFWCHSKGMSAFTVPTYRRLFILCNNEDLSLMPELDDSLTDKLHLFSVKKFEMPAGCQPLPDRHDQAACDAFLATLASELPYFLFDLEQFQAPEDIKSRRFGVVAYQSEDVARDLEELSEYHQRHAVIQASVFTVDLERACSSDMTELETNELYEVLVNGKLKERAQRLFRNARSLGSCLGHIAKKDDFKKWYSFRRSNSKTYWTIKNADAMR